MPKTVEMERSMSLGYQEGLRREAVESGKIILEGGLGAGCLHQLLLEVQLAIKRGNKQIDCYLHSPGGELYSAVAMYNVVTAARRQGVKVDMYVMGLAASGAAMVLLQSATRRFASPDSRFMVHEIRTILSDELTHTESQELAKESRRAQELTYGILSRRCKKSVAEITRLVGRKSLWMNAEEAVKWGLVDAIKLPTL